MFPVYPYLNIQDLNLDYILRTMRQLQTDVKDFVSINAIKYADPIQWDITRQYEKNTVVIDPLTGTAYISVAPVPSGVAITRTEYWTVVFDLGSFVARAAQNFTDRYEPESTLISSFTINTGEWLVWGDILYKAIAPIAIGDYYVIGTNIEHFTIEDLYNTYLNTIANILSMVGDLADLDTSDKTSIVIAINEVVADVLNNSNRIGNLANLTTSDKSDLVNAINEVNGNVGDLSNLTTTDTSSIVNAINEVNGVVNNIVPHVTNIYNAVELGLVPYDSTVAVANSTILNTALSEGKTIFIPDGDFYIGAPISMPPRTGIIGNGVYNTALICTGDFNAVEVPVSVDGPEGVATSVTLKNLTLLGTLTANTQNNSKGLYLYNYTFNVTCNRDQTAYQAYNNGYALEYRECDFSMLRITAFKYGIYSDNFTSLITIRDSFVVFCMEAALYLVGSDSIIENIYTANSYYGMVLNSEALKVTNCKCYYNGVVIASSTHANPSAGIYVFSQWARNIVLTACEVQENWQTGLVVTDSAHDIVLNGVICDANGYNTLDTNNIGAEFSAGVYNISGTLTCMNKNTTVTQRLGCYISSDSYNFNILYMEDNQQNPIQLAGYYTYNNLKHKSNNYYSEGVLNTTYFANEGETHTWAFYDGQHIDIHFKIKAIDDVPANTELLDLTDLMNHVTSAGTQQSYFDFPAYNLIGLGFKSLYMASNKIYTGESVTTGDILEVTMTYRPKYFA